MRQMVCHVCVCACIAGAPHTFADKAYPYCCLDFLHVLQTPTHAHTHTHTNAIYPWDSRLYGLIITFICSPPPAPPPCSPVLYLTTCHSTITCRDNWNHATITFVVWLDFMSQAKLSRDNTENPPPSPHTKKRLP